LLSEKLQEMGHFVAGVDVADVDGVNERMGMFTKADLNQGIPAEIGKEFDVVLAADVIEHLTDPATFLGQVKTVISPDGLAIFCVPNVAHWYPRFRMTLGLFDYDQRGILDRTHLRFFTRRSFRRLVERNGFTIQRLQAVGLPLDVLGVDGTRGKWLRLLDHFLLAVWPTMFGYQFIIEASVTD
jgi:predicted TPR repeat methyltransferase